MPRYEDYPEVTQPSDEDITLLKTSEGTKKISILNFFKDIKEKLTSVEYKSDVALKHIRNPNYDMWQPHHEYKVGDVICYENDMDDPYDISHQFDGIWICITDHTSSGYFPSDTILPGGYSYWHKYTSITGAIRELNSALNKTQHGSQSFYLNALQISVNITLPTAYSDTNYTIVATI